MLDNRGAFTGPADPASATAPVRGVDLAAAPGHAGEDPHAPAFVGSSTALAALRDVARGVAQRRCTVLLSGETGTGKEVLARHIHHCSGARAAGPFVPVDCSALTDTLFESQLFGHARGAFTGAVRPTLGFARAADGGTLFLDEVGELSLPLQAKLLRLVQERCVTPVGESRPVSVDVRFVCATHRDLGEMVRRGTFRQDLYFRLNVVVLQLPPLRERPEDVIPLARHFLDLQAELYEEATRTLDDEAQRLLCAHPWPGNVRELANAVEHAHVLAGDDGVIHAQHLPERVRGRAADDGVETELCLANVERRTIAEALRRTRGNRTAASRLLGIPVQKLRRRIEKLQVG